jgi:hypothetical protein
MDSIFFSFSFSVLAPVYHVFNQIREKGMMKGECYKNTLYTLFTHMPSHMGCDLYHMNLTSCEKVGV